MRTIGIDSGAEKRTPSPRSGDRVWVKDPRVREGGGYWRRLPKRSSAVVAAESRFFGLLGGDGRNADPEKTIERYARYGISVPDPAADSELQPIPDTLNSKPRAVRETIAGKIGSLYADLDKSGDNMSIEHAYVVHGETGRSTVRFEGDRTSVGLCPSMNPDALDINRFPPGERRAEIDRRRALYGGFTDPPYEAVHCHPAAAAPSPADMFGIAGDSRTGSVSRQKSNTVVDTYGNTYNVGVKDDFLDGAFNVVSAARSRGIELNPVRFASAVIESTNADAWNALDRVSRRGTGDAGVDRVLKDILSSPEKMDHTTAASRDDGRVRDLHRFVASHASNLYCRGAGVTEYDYNLSPKFKKIETRFRRVFDMMESAGREREGEVLQPYIEALGTVRRDSAADDTAATGESIARHAPLVSKIDERWGRPVGVLPLELLNLSRYGGSDSTARKVRVIPVAPAGDRADTSRDPSPRSGDRVWVKDPRVRESGGYWRKLPKGRGDGGTIVSRIAGAVESSSRSPEGTPFWKKAAAVGAATVGIPLVTYLAAREKYRSGFGESARMAAEMAKDVKTLDVPDDRDSITFTVGGFYGLDGKESKVKSEGYLNYKVSKEILDDTHFSILHENDEFSASSKEMENRDPDSWVEGTIQHYRSTLDPIMKGRNPEAVKLAAKIIAYKQKYPDKKINSIGHSAGGMINREVAEILRLHDPDSEKWFTAVNLGSGYFGMTDDRPNVRSIALKTDGYLGLMAPPGPNTTWIDDGGGGDKKFEDHVARAYMNSPGVVAEIKKTLGIGKKERKTDSLARPFASVPRSPDRKGKIERATRAIVRRDNACESLVNYLLSLGDDDRV